MRLLELFDQPAAVKVTAANDHQVIMQSNLSDDTVLKLVFSQIRHNRWKFAFTRHTINPGIMNRVRGAVGMDKKMSAGTYGKTDQGNQTEVFSTVVAALKQFYSQYDPLQLSFTADKGDAGMDTSRASLYATMVRRMFKRTEYDVQVDDAGGFDQFTITKKELRDAPQRTVQ